jgi:hypothetical protein
MLIPTGRTLYFNPKTEKFVKDKEADKYLKHPQRKPFIVPHEV